ncbi:MAG: flavodoxin family protein, partial [Lentisphaeria bacterium]|nr:flavodoxin family protein [Lentisphaeria bacterium]
MKVLAINASPRSNGNTATMLRAVLQEAEKAGLETELVQLGGHKVSGCRACM